MGVMLMSGKIQVLFVLDFLSKFDLLTGESTYIKKFHIEKKSAWKPYLF